MDKKHELQVKPLEDEYFILKIQLCFHHCMEVNPLKLIPAKEILKVNRVVFSVQHVQGQIGAKFLSKR